jgi:two-component system, NarL family, sensor histidine kinase UhpB
MVTPMSLLRRVFIANSALLVAGALALAFTPMQISATIALRQAAVLAVWVVLLLAANLVLLRPLFAPLGRLAERMENVDVLRVGQETPVAGPAEVRALERAFNVMLGRLGEERREAGRRALVAQEQERARIALGLHDEVGQTMTGVLFQLKRLADDASPEQRGELEEAQESVRTSLDEVRRIAQELRPELLDHLGLASAVTSLCTTFSRRTGIAVERRIEKDLPQLDDNTELVLFRVTQEGLTNIARHAEASEAHVSLLPGVGSVVLRIADNGRGFSGSSVERGGLRGIRERALIVNGSLAVKRHQGGGVEIRLEVPTANGSS